MNAKLWWEGMLLIKKNSFRRKRTKKYLEFRQLSRLWPGLELIRVRVEEGK